MTHRNDPDGDFLRGIKEQQEKHLIPLKEDLAEWLNKTLDVDYITPENFMHVLDNGVVVCKLAQIIQKKAEELQRQGLSSKNVPSFKFKCWENAKSQTFYARDNTENFIKWCRKFGVREAVIFESDSLVLHTQPRTIVLCLLELGRIAASFDMEAPGLIQFEREIEEQDSGQSDSCSSRTSSPGLRGDGEPRGVPLSASKTRLSELDKKVMQITSDCGCEKLPIHRISEGRYNIAGRTVFVRLLKEKHVMVRVGGGWDTLEHFLARHDPCQLIMVNGKPTASLDESMRIDSVGSAKEKKWTN